MTSGTGHSPDTADQFARRLKYAFLLCVLFYAAGVLAFVAWSNHRARLEILADIDQRLMIAAESLKYMLGPDFHDRAVDASSISLEEEMANREVITRFAQETDFQWLYTLVEKDGRFYFAAPTVTEEEARDQKRWYFHPYADIPEAFVPANCIPKYLKDREKVPENVEWRVGGDFPAALHRVIGKDPVITAGSSDKHRHFG